MNRRLTNTGPDPLDCIHRPICAAWKTKDGPSVRVCRLATDHLHRCLSLVAGRLTDLAEERRLNPYIADYSTHAQQDWYDRFVNELTARGELISTSFLNASTDGMTIDAELLPEGAPDSDPPQRRPPQRRLIQGTPVTPVTPVQPHRRPNPYIDTKLDPS